MATRTIYIKVGQRLKSIRKAKGLSQEALAWKANVNRSYIWAIENGRKKASLQTFEKLSKALDIELFHLFQIDD